MSFIDEVRSIKVDYVLRDEIKQKILNEAKKGNKYVEISSSELKQNDIRALEQEKFILEKTKKKEVDPKNEEYEVTYYKISW
jgi:hypothetical protein